MEGEIVTLRARSEYRYSSRLDMVTGRFQPDGSVELWLQEWKPGFRITPLQLRVGASGQLLPGLMLSASAARADWSSTGDDIGGGVEAGSTLAFGAGLELSNVRLLFGRATPLRVGFRRTDLPFSLEGGDANEQVWSGGFGFALNETNEIVLASLDLGAEKGRRVGGTYREEFWRGTLSLRLLGF